MASKTAAVVYVHEMDYDGLYDAKLNEEEIVKTKVLPVDKAKVVTLKEADIIQLGNTKLEIIHTPGHTPGSICLYNEAEKTLISGDTLFDGGFGRTDLRGGSMKEMEKSLEKLEQLPSGICVFPGHGESFKK